MNSLKIFFTWLIKCVLYASDAAIVVWLLHKFNLMDVPLIFIFYFGIIISTYHTVLVGINRWLAKYDKTEKE